MLVGHLADVLEIGKFPIAQDGCPNHLAHSATIIGMRDSEPCHRGAQVQLLITGRRHRLRSLVVLDPVTNPLIVECLRGFIHDELQAHLLAPVASNDLDKSGSTPALLPKALAMLAHIAASGDTLLFANDFPRGDGTQDQSTLSFGQKMCFSFPPTFFLESLPITEFTCPCRESAPTAAAPNAGAPTGRSGSKPKARMASSE